MIPPLQPHEEATRLEARRLARRVLAPKAGGWEERAEFPREVFRDLCQLGLGAMTLPRENGGASLSHVGAVAAFEELAYGDLSTAFALLCQNSCVRTLSDHGTSDQRNRWLYRLASGGGVGAYVITEPDAGSDVAAMRASGTKAVGGWKLEGEKWLLSNAPVADVFIVSVKTDGDAGAKGISSFLLARDTGGLDIGARERTVGARALPVGSIRMRGCVVPENALLGEANDGFKIALDAVNFARVAWGGLATGLARAALDQAIAYVGERRQFDRAIGSFQAIQFQLADLATEIEKVRLLAYRAAALMDAGDRYIEAAAMAKRAAGDMAVRVTSEALELLGGRGYLAPNPLERFARQARIAQLADGTTNVQRLVIGRRLLADGHCALPPVPVDRDRPTSEPPDLVAHTVDRSA